MVTLKGYQLLPHLPRIRTDTPGFLLECARRYGDWVHFDVGVTQAFFINHPDAVRHVLQENNRNYTKDTIQYRTLALITGQGLLTADGEPWLQHRRLIQPAFARSRLMGLDEVVVGVVDRMLARWKSRAKQNEIIDVDHEMLEIALEVVGLALFGLDLSREAPQLVRAVLTALDYVIYRAQNLVVPPLAWPTPRNRAFKRALFELDQAVEAILTSHQVRDKGEETLLDLLVRAEQVGQLTRQQVRDELVTMIVAGHETVATALTWTWYLLAHHPEVEAALIAEIDSVLGGRPPGREDVPKMTYTAQVFAEALRLYPPAWLITRRALAADTISDHPIPARALIIISPYVLHRHPAFWVDAEVFRPERFDERQARAYPRFAYIPFGAGPRLCIGNQFALVEAQLVLSRILQRYRLAFAGAGPVRAEPLVTLRPKGGMPMRLIPR